VKICACGGQGGNTFIQKRLRTEDETAGHAKAHLGERVGFGVQDFENDSNPEDQTMIVDIDEYTRLQDDGCPNCPGHLGSAWQNHAMELITRTMTARMEFSGKLEWTTSNAPKIRM
jgi:hypothetical protein